MRATVRQHWLPKAGNAPEEYEDAFAHSLGRWRFAMADGATESSFAADWARALVEAFVADPPFRAVRETARREDWLAPLQRAWREAIDWERLPWFALAKAESGAFSTVLGVEFMPECEPQRPARKGGSTCTDSLCWRALAVGDTCLYQLRGDDIIASFPLDQPDQFGSCPVLLSSTPASNEGVWDQVRVTEGNCRGEDVFVLATDALAQWFLAEHLAGGQPGRSLLALGGEEEFAALIGSLRQRKLMRNDDVTLLTVRLDRPDVSQPPGLPRRRRPGWPWGWR